MKARLTKPENGNPYYNTKGNGGYSTAIVGCPMDTGCNVLANCVGYACGRFHEIAEDKTFGLLPAINAENWMDMARKRGLETGTVPRVGAVMVWQKGASLSGEDGAGHVAIVEQVISPAKVVTSESGYGAAKPFWTQTRVQSDTWGQPAGYKFLGFIYNPAVAAGYDTPTRPVRKGDTGDAVRWLQARLIERGYLRGTELDGDFGKITLGAVLAFQMEQNLEVDGVCGPATRASLMS